MDKRVTYNDQYSDWLQVKNDRQKQLNSLTMRAAELEKEVERSSRTKEGRQRQPMLEQELRGVNQEIYDVKKELQAQRGL